MHETLPIKIENWQSFYNKFTTEYVEGYYGRFLIKRSRIEGDLTPYINDLARAYKKAQTHDQNWRNGVFLPLLDAIKKKAENGKTILHAKPTHDYSGEKNKWWEYEYSESRYGWGYHFNWIDEPKKKINHDLGQSLYELDRYQRKFHKRTGVLESLLGQNILKHIYKIYNYEWLDKNQFSNKVVKVTLLDDEYWYRITHNRSGVPVWENFIWQSNETVEINL